ncbi:hypothetical protein [Chryseolinea soli]|nr:hypothetical protein [Chryseolinea soli]
MRYFDAYYLPTDLKDVEIKEIEDFNLIFDETLDITFCELKTIPPILQPAWDFGAFKIEGGSKAVLNLNDAGVPDASLVHGFCGRIRHDLRDIRLISRPTLHLDLKFQGTFGRFHLFSSPKVITDVDDYRGCSGAPILDETGKLVGLVQSVVSNTTSVYAFSIDECRRLIDIAIATNML